LRPKENILKGETSPDSWQLEPQDLEAKKNDKENRQDPTTGASGSLEA
jgi:hypothetical protein